MISLILGAMAALATSGCNEKSKTQIRIVSLEGLPAASGSINGKPVRIIIDTGTGVSRIPETMLSRISLPLLGHTDLNGEGDERTYQAEVSVNGFDIGKIELGTVPSLPEAAWNSNTIVLGMEALGKYGIVLDLGNDEISLLDQKDCSLSSLVPVGKRVTRREKSHYTMHVNVQIGRIRVDALIDSGASHTALSAETASRLRINASKTEIEDTNGIKTSAVSTALIPSLRIAGKTYTRYPVFVDSNLNGHQDMILGHDVLSDFVIAMSSRASDALIFKER